MKTKLFILLLILSWASIDAQESDTRFRELVPKIEQTLQDYHAAGVAIAVVENGKTIYTQGIGYRDFDEKLPVDENTLFAIGSCSKAFTASMLGVLEDDYKLSLSDTPRRHIPELEFYNDDLNHNLQIRHLLSHSMGISNMATESSMVLFPTKDLEGLVPRLQYLEPSAIVGTEFIYSNLGYGLAALISQQITGKHWTTNLSDLIFQKLEMNRSTVGFKNAVQKGNHALGYGVHKEQTKPVLADNSICRAPAGNVFSSINDLSNWVKTWLNEGSYNNKQVIPAGYVHQATVPQQALAPNEEGDTTMFAGFGWFINTHRGLKKVHHSGAVSGYTANIVLYPSKDLGIIVLTNQTNSNLCYTITEHIEDCLLNIQKENEEPSEIRYGNTIEVTPPPSTMELNQEAPPSHNLEDYVGKYSCDGFGTFSVEMKDGHLYTKFPFTSFRLVHSENDFFTSEFAEVIPTVMSSAFFVFTFQNDDTGKLTGVSVNMDADGVVFTKK